VRARARAHRRGAALALEAHKDVLQQVRRDLVLPGRAALGGLAASGRRAARRDTCAAAAAAARCLVAIGVARGCHAGIAAAAAAGVAVAAGRAADAQHAPRDRRRHLPPEPADKRRRGGAQKQQQQQYRQRGRHRRARRWRQASRGRARERERAGTEKQKMRRRTPAAALSAPRALSDCVSGTALCERVCCVGRCVGGVAYEGGGEAGERPGGGVGVGDRPRRDAPPLTSAAPPPPARHTQPRARARPLRVRNTRASEIRQNRMGR